MSKHGRFKLVQWLKIVSGLYARGGLEDTSNETTKVSKWSIRAKFLI